jgi:hypothetical protein
MQGHQQVSPTICLSCMVKDCATCSAANVCSNCNIVNSVAYFPSPTGDQCMPCDKRGPGMAGCISCSTSNSCGLCANGFQLSTNSSTNSTSRTGICIKCRIQNCDTCEISGSQVQCKKCALGYSANNGNCNYCQFPCATCN